MIAVCQPFLRTAEFHLSIDALMIKSISLALSGEPVAYLTDAVNLKRMAEHLGRPPANLTMAEAGVPDRGARRLNLRIRLLVNLAGCRKKARELKARRLVYLAFDSVTGGLASARPGRIPEYYVVHNNFHRSLVKPAERPAFRRIAARARRLIFLEEAIADAARARYRLDPAKTAVVPFPIESMPPGEFSGPDPGKGVLFAGRLTKDKGADVLLEAARILKRRAPQALQRQPVRVIGPYHSGSDPRDYADCAEYSDRRLTDAELADAIRSSAFIVIPYERAAYAYVTPGTAFRALGYGKPVLVTDLPSMRSLIQSPRPVGFAFSNSSQLAEILERIAYMPRSDYDALCDGVRRFAERRDVSAAAAGFREALDADR
ncbi:MAG: glycosyltransferase [Acidobacteriota bacterium]|nr:glycosyltransferase [Acidobacteriota bacterium]